MRNRRYLLGMGLLLILLGGSLSSLALPTNAPDPNPDGAPPLKLEGALAQLLSPDGKDPRRTKLQVRASTLRISQGDGIVSVIVERNPMGFLGSAGLLAEIRALGGSVEAQSSCCLRVRIPPQRLGELARLPGVAFVRRPYRPYALGGPAYATGALPTGALALHGYGIQGQGVRVAIIDIGFEGLGDALRRGLIDPKAIVATRDYSGQGLETGGDHGLQVARIVHEMAPKAELILMNLGEEADEVVLENAVEEAVRLGARVINHSIGWFDTNFGDGTGVVNEIVRRAYERGVLWVNAAGNQAQAHWTGLLRDDDRDGWAEFSFGREEIFVGSAPARDGGVFVGGTVGVITLVLVWDDWPRTRQDLDLYLLNGRGEVVAQAAAPQRGLDPPRELLEYWVREPGIFKLKVKIRRVDRPLRIKIFSLQHPLTPSVPHGSVVAPADCPCALAVGAINLRQWDEGVVEPFSARGPTSDGRVKPDLVAPDSLRDPGTSFAAPHVAGAAALLLSRRPAWSVEELREALERDALDIGPPGKDVESGAGKLHLSVGYPQAVRSLSARTLRPEESAGVEVRVSVRMPAARFGALTLAETVPPGFVLEPVENAGAALSLREEEGEEGLRAQWTWPTLGPGDAREVVYRLRVLPGVPPGRYELRGELNGQPVQGDRSFEVLPCDSDSESDTEGLPARGARVEVRRTLQGLLFSPKGLRLPHGSWRVRVFAPGGQPVFDSRPVPWGQAVLWNLRDSRGRPVANGVYLVVVSREGAHDPRTPQHPPIRIQKIVILRRR